MSKELQFKFKITEYADKVICTRIELIVDGVNLSEIERERRRTSPRVRTMHIPMHYCEYVLRWPTFLDWLYRRGIKQAKKKLKRRYLESLEPKDKTWIEM